MAQRRFGPALPVEKSYAFHKALSEDSWHTRLDPSAKPASGEMAIPKNGWVIVIRSGAGEPLRQAADDLRDYLETGMLTHLQRQSATSLADWEKRERAIVAGARQDLPGCGITLTGTKDYEIIVKPERVVVCGYDELGAMYGLYNLEGRMDLREAPFLPRDLNTARHSLYKARMALSGLGWMEFPDKYLAWLPRYGFDSIFASVYANPSGATTHTYLSDLPIGVPKTFNPAPPDSTTRLLDIRKIDGLVTPKDRRPAFRPAGHRPGYLSLETDGNG